MLGCSFNFGKEQTMWQITVGGGREAMRAAGAVVGLGFLGSGAMAQPQHYVLDDAERVTSIEHVEKTSDGGYILTGKIAVLGPNRVPLPSDVWIAKYTGNDVLQWEQSIGVANIEDAGIHVQEVPAGGYVVAFRTDSPGNNRDQGLVRLTPAGGLVWSRTYLASYDTFDKTDFAVRVAGANLVLVGSVQQAVNQPNFATLHSISLATGNPIIQSVWNAGAVRLEAFTDIRVLPGGNWLVCGNAVIPQSPAGPEHRRAMVMVFNPNTGGVLWANTYGPTPLNQNSFAFSSATGLALAPNGTDFLLNGDVSAEIPSLDVPRGLGPVPTRFIDGLYVMRGAIGGGAQVWYSVLEQTSAASSAVLMPRNQPFVAGSRPFGDGDQNGIVYGFDFGTGLATDKNSYAPVEGQFTRNNAFATLAEVTRADGRFWLPAGRLLRVFQGDGAYLARADGNGFADCFVFDPNLINTRLDEPRGFLQPANTLVQGNNEFVNMLSDPNVPQLAIACEVVPCGPADVGSEGGAEGPDGVLDNNDFIVFIGYFFAMDPRADLGSTGGAVGSDGVWDNNDFIVFINFFFEGC
jgi:hypothetical protein